MLGETLPKVTSDAETTSTSLSNISSAFTFDAVALALFVKVDEIIYSLLLFLSDKQFDVFECLSFTSKKLSIEPVRSPEMEMFLTACIFVPSPVADVIPIQPLPVFVMETENFCVSSTQTVTVSLTTEIFIWCHAPSSDSDKSAF